ncbi:hypothetical protein [Streptomyces sp. SAS_260]|uniref:hypothetical protein n=1 Tax=Streptomyces sp. SAS_260 TaxID=3412751 RepID=UPI00403C083D
MVIKLIISQDGADEPEAASTAAPAPALASASASAEPTAPAVAAGTTFSPVTPTAAPPHSNAVSPYATAGDLNFTYTTAATPPIPSGTAAFAYPSATFPAPYPTVPVLPTQPDSRVAAPASTSGSPAQHQLPAPSWQAVMIFALLLGALIAFVFVGVEAGTALGLLALIGLIAGTVRRNLS